MSDKQGVPQVVWEEPVEDWTILEKISPGTFFRESKQSRLLYIRMERDATIGYGSNIWVWSLEHRIMFRRKPVEIVYPVSSVIINVKG